ncbi:transposase [Streptomyces sp. DH10]|uniref:transposase n=1 Tax=Streptomyces sp. DH10 TaxID=3040121 RepID=UPI0024432436|nr:transposase [Streptomyces sp. DH10]MDG9712630.1 transposase [Streptomyces sp. DH10]
MPAQRRYPPDVMERAVRMVLDIRAQDPDRAGVVGTVGDLMKIHPEVLRHWVKKAEANRREPTPEAPAGDQLRELEREVRDLRRANAVLRAATLMFASELELAQTR